MSDLILDVVVLVGNRVKMRDLMPGVVLLLGMYMNERQLERGGKRVAYLLKTLRGPVPNIEYVLAVDMDQKSSREEGYLVAVVEDFVITCLNLKPGRQDCKMAVD